MLAILQRHFDFFEVTAKRLRVKTAKVLEPTQLNITESGDQRVDLRGRQKQICQVKEASSILDMKDLRLKQCVEFLVEIWVISEIQKNQFNVLKINKHPQP